MSIPSQSFWVLGPGWVGLVGAAEGLAGVEKAVEEGLAGAGKAAEGLAGVAKAEEETACIGNPANHGQAEHRE